MASLVWHLPQRSPYRTLGDALLLEQFERCRLIGERHWIRSPHVRRLKRRTLQREGVEGNRLPTEIRMRATLCVNHRHQSLAHLYGESMLHRVHDDMREFLLTEPESGMGYQLLQKGDEEDHLLVLNAELIFPERLLHKLPGDQAHSRALVTADPELPTRQIDPRSVKVITHGSYPSQSRKREYFVRYSAYKNDRRIRADGSVAAGTYVTTENDSHGWGRSLTGLAAVGRYALPNPKPAVNVFLMRPRQPVPILCGSVTPAHGQAGGGVEIRFVHDTPPRTVIRIERIPDR